MVNTIAGQGNLIENELFSSVRKEKYEKTEHPDTLEYLDFDQSIDLAKKTQPWENPSAPQTPFAADLRKEVSKKIGAVPENFAYRPDDLKFFTSVGSHLDRWHGTDAFIEYFDRKNNRTYRILIDATIDPNKRLKSTRANEIVLILVPGDGIDKNLEGDQKIWNQIISEKGQEIFNKLSNNN
jgi:hypothetical protein